MSSSTWDHFAVWFLVSSDSFVMKLLIERRLLRAFFVSVLTLLVITCVFLGDFDEDDYKGLSSPEAWAFDLEEEHISNKPDHLSSSADFTNSPYKINDTRNHTSKTLAEDISILSPNELLRREIILANQEQRIRNLDKFDLSRDETGIVIVIQVHNRSEYLRHLVDSLSTTKGISEVLLIFSHDVYSKELNEIIERIDFCLVVQIFYPFSIQLHETEFPGDDPRDCPKTVTRQEALEMNCLNAIHPDKYGHYREAGFTQAKHHWFWKMNHVFDHMNVTKYFDGIILFLEEDHYAVDDFLHVLKLMYRMQKRLCGDCSLLTLGGYDEKLKTIQELSQVDVLQWTTIRHNIGMAMNRKTWQEIKACGQVFCTFDDYNWDWTLNHIGVNCLPNHLKTFVIHTPRIRHIGECGMHNKKSNCDAAERIRQIKASLQEKQMHLFPDQLKIVQNSVSLFSRPVKENGGWGDPRDHSLCVSFMDALTH